jgi:hypothetical protein
LNFQTPAPLPFQLAFPINPYIIIGYADTARLADTFRASGGRVLKSQTFY